MNRLTKIFLKNLLYVPKTFYRLYRYAENHNVPEAEKYKLLQYIVKRSLLKGDIEIEAYGTENIPKEDGFIFYPNHQGIFDGFAMLHVCQKFFSPVIKQELLDYPVSKQIFMCLDSIPMDREDVKQSMAVMKEVEHRVRGGRNCLIFPEGTRSKNGNRLNEFKGGSFRPALKTKCPIVPVALIDSYKPFDQNEKGHICVQVHILKPIPYEEYGKLKSVELAALVKGQIEETIRIYEKAGKKNG